MGERNEVSANQARRVRLKPAQTKRNPAEGLPGFVSYGERPRTRRGTRVAGGDGKTAKPPTIPIWATAYSWNFVSSC